jgi:hypothetical protein
MDAASFGNHFATRAAGSEGSVLANDDQLSRKPVGAKLARDWGRSVDKRFCWSTAIASKLCSHRFCAG